MSAKWERVKRWEDEFFPAWAWPAKFVLRAFSSIPLAVVLLSIVAVYGALASVPVGLLALAPTYALYGLTLLAVMAVVAGLPLVGLRMGLRGAPRGARFAVMLLGGLGLGVAGVYLWWSAAWPRLHYDPATGRGLRLFAQFAHDYSSTTVRRLPGMEMTELEFYSWWPLRLILLMFIVNMVVATVRRIEFCFPNIGVLTVHTGIVLIALGSVFYGANKLEGELLLLAGPPDDRGNPTPGRPESAFYDNMAVALWVSQFRGWEQRPLRNVPRYNEYPIAPPGLTARQFIGQLPREEAGRTLNLPVPDSMTAHPRVDPDIRFRVVGYVSYAEPELVTDWVQAELTASVRPGARLNPVRFLDLHSGLADDDGRVSDEPILRFFFLPDRPTHRVSDNMELSIEYTRNMPQRRWRALAEELPPGARHALVVEVPERGYRGVFPVAEGQRVRVGETGYEIQVEDLAPTPPLPIVTEGYENAQSSVAILRVVGPEGAGGGFQRWVYHRFPEISQDILDESSPETRPARRDADESILIDYVDASRLRMYFDERPDGTVRTLVRRPDGSVVVREGLEQGERAELVPMLELRLGERWEHAEPFQRPQIMPPEQRDNSDVGTHEKAFLAVEVVLTDGAGRPVWSRIQWLPFTRFLSVSQDTWKTVALPDGRHIQLVFGRVMHGFPNFQVSLVDFTIQEYDHRGAPRDYRSRLRVTPTDGSFEQYEHITRLNAPLTAPFLWDDSRPMAANVLGRLGAGLNPAQFKLSQAGWDRMGWEETRELADQGILARPYASFTILGVGNNPGIHIIALGGILMGVGIPWAFYIKPLIMRRRKERIQRQIAERGFAPSRGAAAGAPRPAGQPVGATS